MSHNLKTLLTTAAELRAVGNSWATIAQKLHRKTRTCANWPVKYREIWEPIYRDIQQRRFDQTAAELHTHFLALARDDDPKIRTKAQEIWHKYAAKSYGRNGTMVLPQPAAADKPLGPNDRIMVDVKADMDAARQMLDQRRALQGLPPATDDEFLQSYEEDYERALRARSTNLSPKPCNPPAPASPDHSDKPADAPNPSRSDHGPMIWCTLVLSTAIILGRGAPDSGSRHATPWRQDSALVGAGTTRSESYATGRPGWRRDSDLIGGLRASAPLRETAFVLDTTPPIPQSTYRLRSPSPPTPPPSAVPPGHRRIDLPSAGFEIDSMPSGRIPSVKLALRRAVPSPSGRGRSASEDEPDPCLTIAGRPNGCSSSLALSEVALLRAAEPEASAEATPKVASRQRIRRNSPIPQSASVAFAHASGSASIPPGSVGATSKLALRPRFCWMSVLALCLIAVPSAVADEPLHFRIDQHIARGLKDYDKVAAPIASDAEFLRRISLDLTGRIPTIAETRAFLADKDPSKRAKLIDRLLTSPEYARRMQEYWDVVLMDRRRDVRVPRAAWEEYLRQSFADNKPFDQFVRELLSTDGADAKTRPAAKFLLDRALDPTVVTRDIGRLFLGMNLQCCQCHDHPLVDAYKQEHYYGIQAFISRASLFPDANYPSAVIAEKADGDTTFTSVFDKNKVQKTTAPRMPFLKPINDPKLEKGKEYKVAPAKGVKQIPAYSRFAQLANAVTAKDNTAFPRTIANRLWAMMLGRGLVHPLDFDHDENPPSHPELLDLLGDEFAKHKFDEKWLLREIALSKTYQRSSEQRSDVESPSPSKFAVAQLKPLSPEQFAYAVMQATGFTDAERLALGAKMTEPELQKRLAPNLQPFRNMFGTRGGEPEEGFAATLDQTLFLKHGATIRTMIAQRNGNLLDRVAKLSDNALVADELFLSVFTRPPLPEERQDVADVLKGQSNRTAALAEVIWAMLASAEFRFCH